MSMGLAKQTTTDGLTSVQNKMRMMGLGAPPPTDPAMFPVGGQVPEQTLAVLKRLGVATELR
jgi:hypothetical protein